YRKAMIEILADLEVVKRPQLELPELSLEGVAFRARGRAIPRDRIVEVTFSPIVFRSSSGTNIRAEYFDQSGAEIPLDRVIDSVIDADGMVHFANKLSFKLAAGTIVGFSLYGPRFEAFGTVEAPDDVITMFGRPDRSRENISYGDLMGWDFYYAGSRKLVSWDAFEQRISLINLGDYPHDF
ncbi:MAG TPA: hypothetical protein VF403_15810, partial [Kofleriaceae bacterium]